MKCQYSRYLGSISHVFPDAHSPLRNGSSQINPSDKRDRDVAVKMCGRPRRSLSVLPRLCFCRRRRNNTRLLLSVWMTKAPAATIAHGARWSITPACTGEEGMRGRKKQTHSLLILHLIVSQGHSCASLYCKAERVMYCQRAFVTLWRPEQRRQSTNTDVFAL